MSEFWKHLSAARRNSRFALVLVPTALLSALAFSIGDITRTQQVFVATTYYCLMALVLCWAGTYLHAAEDVRKEQVIAWIKENWPGLVVAFALTVIVALAIEPALRMLSDEANLVGTSKNLFASKQPTFTVSGKYYYDSFWDVDVAIDRRPTLFPFLVSLIHSVIGYSYRNVFLCNLLILPPFLLVSYRLAKSLGGATFAVVASLVVAAHPVTLLAVRSGGFDFIAAFFALLSIKSFCDFARQQSPAKLAILWLNLCMFSEVRYESALFIAPVLAVLLAFKMLSWSLLRPYAFVYAVSPAFFFPRIWQAVLRGNVPEQEPGATTFSLANFLHNAAEYFQPIVAPRGSYPLHSALLIGLGVVGCVQWLGWLYRRFRRRDDAGRGAPALRIAALLIAWMLAQAAISFTYVWGRAQFPSSARLVIPFDIFFSFAAAWTLTSALARFRSFVPILLAVAVLASQVPLASQHRPLNRLTQTRESSTTWKFFERLGEKRILIVTDRPNHFTIMNYGAMSFDSARHDPYLLTAFARHLFYDIYVIQQLKLSTNQLLPGYELWPTRKLEPVLEFENDADVLVRISRLAH
ncbi:MAG: glycosyltransferase family 39 protein [Polyangiaceae bacterium]